MGYGKRISLMLLASLAFIGSALAQVALTTISDSIANLSGNVIPGTVITATLNQTMTTADSYVILQGTLKKYTIPQSGLFSISLPPNSGSTPTGTSYTVTYVTPNGRVVETWVVPTGGPVRLSAVRALVPPTPSLLIPFPQNIPPSPCLNKNVPVWNTPPGQWVCGTPNVGSVTFDLENPTAADAGKFQWKPKNGLTLTRISCSVDQGSAAINLDLRQESTPNVSGTQVLSTPLACTANTGATTSIANPNVSSLTPVALLVVAASGGVSVVRVHAEYQLSP